MEGSTTCSCGAGATAEVVMQRDDRGIAYPYLLAFLCGAGHEREHLSRRQLHDILVSTCEALDREEYGARDGAQDL
jgi:hypothetical protein